MTTQRRMKRMVRKRNYQLEDLCNRAQDLSGDENLAGVVRYFAQLESGDAEERVRHAAGHCAVFATQYVNGMLEGVCEGVQESTKGALWAAMSKLATALGGETDVEVNVETVEAGTTKLLAPEVFIDATTIKLTRNRKSWRVDRSEPFADFFGSVSSNSKAGAIERYRLIATGCALVGRKWH